MSADRWRSSSSPLAPMDAMVHGKWGFATTVSGTVCLRTILRTIRRTIPAPSPQHPPNHSRTIPAQTPAPFPHHSRAIGPFPHLACGSRVRRSSPSSGGTTLLNRVPLVVGRLLFSLCWRVLVKPPRRGRVCDQINPFIASAMWLLMNTAVGPRTPPAEVRFFWNNFF